MPAPRASVGAAWRDHWPALALALLAALVALWARHTLFPAFSWNRDEPVYLWHVDALRAGQLTPSDGGHPQLFQPWLSARGDGVLFTQYTLGWPLVLLAAAVATGSAGNALLLGAALAVLGTYAFALEVTRDRGLATVAAALMVGSPLLAIQGGVYLSYLFTLGLGLCFGVGLLSGIRDHRPWRLVGAGGLLGWIFMTRPYDAVLWGLAFGGYAVVVHRDRWRTLLRPFVACCAAAAPLVAVTLLYNRHVTGALLRFPITAAEPLDTFGFGERRLMPGFEIVDYDLAKALRGSAKNVFFFPWFLVGTYVGVVAAAVGLWQRRRERSTVVLLLVGLAFPAGYFVFWGNWQSSMFARISGPIYYVPLLAPISVLIATTLVTTWRERRRVSVVLLGALAVGTVPAAVSRFDVNRDISDEQEPWRTSVTDLRGSALVFVSDTAPYLLYLNPFSSNGPDLDDRVLYASDSDPEMLDLIAEMPDRTPYLQQGSVSAPEVGPREDPYDLDVTLIPVEVRRAPALDLAVTASAPPDAARIVVVLEADGVREVRSADGRDGTFAPRFRVTAPGGGGNELAARGHLSITVGYGVDDADALAHPEARHEVEFRVVEGDIEALVPSAAFRNTRVYQELQWRRTPSLPDLLLELTAAPADG